MPPLKRCEQGHYFYPQRHPSCPLCTPASPAASSTPTSAPPDNRPVGWLVRLGATQRGLDYCIKGLDGKIGRQAGLEFSIEDDETVQPHHATLHYDRKDMSFKLEASLVKSVVRLNGEVVDPAIPEPLKGYDIIELGSTRLLFVPLCGPKFRWPNSASPALEESAVAPTPVKPVTNTELRINLRNIPSELPVDKSVPIPEGSDKVGQSTRSRPSPIADTHSDEKGDKPHQQVAQDLSKEPELEESVKATDEDISQALAVWLANKKRTPVSLAALVANGLNHQRATAALQAAKAQHLQSNREQGGQRLIGGLLCLLVGAFLTYTGNRVFVSLLAMGLVFTLVGLVQSISGFDIQ
jgi:hypothetical protein